MKRWLPLLAIFCAGAARAALVEIGSTTVSGNSGIQAMANDASSNELFTIGITTYAVISGTETQTTPIDQFTVNSSSLTPNNAQVYISTFTDAPNVSAASVILEDPIRHRVYAAFGQSSATIVALDETSWVQIASTTLSLSFGGIGTGLLDTTTSFLYLGSVTSPGQIVKIDVSNLAVVSSITLTAPFGNLRSAVLDAQNRFAYFGSSAPFVTASGGVTKINLNNFTFVNSLSFPVGAGGAASAFIDPSVGYAWFGTSDSPGRVVRLQLSNFSLASSVAMHPGEDQLTTAIYDPSTRLAYFGTHLSTAVLVAFDPIHMVWKSELSLGSGRSNLLASAIDTTNHYGYFGGAGTVFGQTKGLVLQVDLIGGVPDITASPTDQEVPVGRPATFGVAAIGRNLRYQWKRDGIAIDSATASTYQIPAVALTDDGARFSCTVSNDNGSVDSGIATLTVQPDVHVFPNPWRADRHAGVPLRFNGLPPGSVVKIFTTAAQFVRSVPESGTVAAWDLKTDGGQNAASGYYFYYVQTRNDRQQVRGKFALIR